MAYCELAEVRGLTGIASTTLISDTDLGYIIAQADREIDNFLDYYGISGSSSDNQVKSASINYSIAGVLNRLRTSGVMPDTLAFDGFKIGTNVDAAIDGYRKRAEEALEAFVGAYSTRRRIWAVNR